MEEKICIRVWVCALCLCLGGSGWNEERHQNQNKAIYMNMYLAKKEIRSDTKSNTQVDKASSIFTGNKWIVLIAGSNL